MSPVAPAVPVEAKTDRKVLIGRAISAVVVLFMVFDGVTKMLVDPHVVKAMAELGWPEGQTAGLGVVILVCTALYFVPRTSVLGAVLLTGFLGGATAVQLRIERASFLFSVGMGVLVWAGLYLRDERVRALVQG